jgi:hypothetical protein
MLRQSLTVRLSPHIRLGLDYAAKRDRRSVSRLVEILLEDALRARGALPDTDDRQPVPPSK